MKFLNAIAIVLAALTAPLLDQCQRREEPPKTQWVEGSEF